MYEKAWKKESKVVVLLSKLIAFFAVLVAVAVVIIVIQKFCFHGNMTLFLSSLLTHI